MHVILLIRECKILAQTVTPAAYNTYRASKYFVVVDVAEIISPIYLLSDVCQQLPNLSSRLIQKRLFRFYGCFVVQKTEDNFWVILFR